MLQFVSVFKQIGVQDAPAQPAEAYKKVALGDQHHVGGDDRGSGELAQEQDAALVLRGAVTYNPVVPRWSDSLCALPTTTSIGREPPL